MNAFAHLMAGWIVLFGLAFFSPFFGPHLGLLAMAFAMLPDIDIFFSKTIKDHHLTYTHSPFLWTILSIIGFLAADIIGFSKGYVVLLLAEPLFHLFCDFTTARTAGIPIFFPFSKKEYSLYPLKKYFGDMAPFSLGKRHLEFLKNYMNNKSLLVYEAAIMITGVAIFFFW